MAAGHERVSGHMTTHGIARSIFEIDVPLHRFPAGRYVDLPGRGGRMFIREMGSPDKPTLVLLHGWTATGAINWAMAMPALARKYHVIAVDQRGHGRGIRGEFTLEKCADDITGDGGLLDVMGIPAAIIAGYSMGGPVAQLAAHRNPSRVDGLVLCATAARFPQSKRFAFPLHLAAGALGVLPPALLQRVPLPAKIAQLPLVNILDDMRRSDPIALLRAGEELAKFDSRSWLSTLRCPVAQLMTLGDLLVPLPEQREVARLTKAKIFAVGSVGGHFVVGVNAGEFTEQLVAAVDDVAGRHPLRQATRSSFLDRRPCAWPRRLIGAA